MIYETDKEEIKHRENLEEIQKAAASQRTRFIIATTISIIAIIISIIALYRVAISHNV